MKHILFNRPLRTLLVTNALILISAAMLGPISALFVEKIGGDLLDASVAGGIFACAAGLTTIVSGKYADKVKQSKWVMAFGYLLMAIGFFLYNFVSTVIHLFLVQILIGFAEAIYSPAFDKLYSEHLSKHSEGLQWGYWEAMNYFTVAIGAFAGGFIVYKLGFGAIFIIMSILSLSSAIYIFLLSRELSD
jgi:sugar phosphate permease